MRDGAPAGANRSDMFHTVVGHYLGCGWSAEQICEHLQQFPDGIGGRYLSEGRLARRDRQERQQVQRRALPLLNGWMAPTAAEAKAPPPEPESPDAER